MCTTRPERQERESLSNRFARLTPEAFIAHVVVVFVFVSIYLGLHPPTTAHSSFIEERLLCNRAHPLLHVSGFQKRLLKESGKVLDVFLRKLVNLVIYDSG